MATQPTQPLENGMILPGDTGVLLGHKAIYGFQGSVPSGGYNPGANGPSTLATSGVSRTIAIAARPGDHPSTQRQLIWRIKHITGTAALNLQVSVDGSDFITVDTVSTMTDSTRVIGAERGAVTAIPDAQATAKILSSARFIRVQDTGSGTTAYVDVTCM
jgi:hypothetical protein